MSFYRKRRRFSFLDKIRSLSGSAADKHVPKSMNPPLITSTPPSPTSTSPPRHPSPSSLTTTTTTTTPPSNDLSALPRKHRSRSFGDAAHVLGRRPSIQQSSPLATSDLSFASSTIREIRDEESSNESTTQRSSGRDSVSPDVERVDPYDSKKVVRKRASSGGDLVLKGVASLAPPRGSKVFSAKGKASEEKSDRTALTESGSRDGDLSWQKGPGPAADDLHDSSKSSGPGNGGSAKSKRRSVCLLEPAIDAAAMRLRRSNSDRVTHGEDDHADHSRRKAPEHAARRSTIAAQSRKSMPTLSVGFEPQIVQEAEQDSRPTESPRETRKSGGSGASTSGSNGGDNVTTQLENSSPKLPSASKKSADYNQLPPHVSKSKNVKFHKLFKNVPMDEYPIDTYSCAFKGDILLQGLMYVSQNWICFYSKIRARGRLLEIPLEKVISITREKLALIIPNAIGIQVADQKYVFGSFISRDNTYKLLVTLWKHSQDSANKAGRPGLVSGSHQEDEITHSADVSGESDTTDDNESGLQETDALLETAQSSTQSSVSTSRVTEAGGDAGRSEAKPAKMAAGIFSLRCVEGRKVFDILSWFTVRLQTIPRTNLLLAICGILVVFLMMSAAGLTYKILLLQTRLEMSHLWTPGRQHSLRDQTMSSLYTLQSQTHLATIHQLHDVLKANIQLLEQVHQSLKSLQGPATTAVPECPPK